MIFETALGRLRELAEFSLVLLPGLVVGVIVLGLLVGAAIAFPSVGAAQLLPLLGIGGVAVGFAVRDILQNARAGVLILLARPFRTGEQVVAGGRGGTVEPIKLRATTISSCDNRRTVIPPTDMFTDKVLVNTAYGRRRLRERIGIGNADDITHAKRVMAAAAPQAAGVDLPFPTAQILFQDPTEATDARHTALREGWSSRGAADPTSRAVPGDGGRRK